MKLSCAWICSAIVIVSGGVAFGEEENLVQTPAFEAKGLSSWQWSASPDAHATGELDSGVSHSGKKSFRIT